MSLLEFPFRTGPDKATAKCLISNLTARGYLQQDGITKRYEFKMRLFELGGIVFSTFDLHITDAYPMDRLSNGTAATILLESC